MPGLEAPLARGIEQQAEAALDEASVVLFVVDARAGASGLDQELASMLRRRGSDPLLVANKVDSARSNTRVAELHTLGLGSALEISAEHGRGVEELIAAVERRLPEAQDEIPPDRPLSVAVVGRPNVGKSSLARIRFSGPWRRSSSRREATAPLFQKPKTSI